MQKGSRTPSMSTGSNDSSNRCLDPKVGIVSSTDKLPLCRITPKEWFAVARWSWDVPEESCMICKCALVEACVECQARGMVISAPLSSHSNSHHDFDSYLRSSSSPLMEGEDCRIALGCCNHVFHDHCLSRWLVQNTVCPVCTKKWKLLELTSND
ncbi:unnamed protein product [Phytomonas sp. Hart1]|nr:unnamed protein product [Phytomonas sp. Hart1]|eukprot:CCW71697.1 unnamed protein product [Phytomonas sp. isolate Hart1]